MDQLDPLTKYLKQEDKLMKENYVKCSLTHSELKTGDIKPQK